MIYIAPVETHLDVNRQALESVGWSDEPCCVCGRELLVPPSVWRVGGPEMVCEPCYWEMNEIMKRVTRS